MARAQVSTILTALGCLAFLLGIVDPLEGSVVILAGSFLVLLGKILSADHGLVRLWSVVLLLIAAGVAALFGLTAIGGVGGSSGRSIWWALLILPYPLGWLLGVGGVVALLRQHRSPAN